MKKGGGLLQKDFVLWLVIPCYNEQAVLPTTAPLFLREMTKLIAAHIISPDSKICFVDDGSLDNTWRIISELSQNNPIYQGIRLAHNAGHQHALLCGLAAAKNYCDACISSDCDGQDDIGIISSMAEKYLEGYDIVYGVRSRRETDTFFKRMTAELYYRLLKHMGVDIVFNHADYRLMSARALAALAEFKERNLFLRGIVPLLGFNTTQVEYERHERIAGTSHYPLRKMLALAFNGIASFSVSPIHFIAGVGCAFSLLGFAGIFWVILSYALHLTVPGWSSLALLICLFGGLQLLALGIIGEYIGKIYIEVKRRPRYIVSECTWKTSDCTWKPSDYTDE